MFSVRAVSRLLAFLVLVSAASLPAAAQAAQPASNAQKVAAVNAEQAAAGGPPVPSTTAAPTSTNAQDALAAIHRTLQSVTNANTFAGMVDDPQNGTVTEYVTPDAYNAVRSALQAANEQTQVSVIQVDHTYASLVNLTDLIHQDYGSLPTGIQAQYWAPDAASNTVEVQVTSNVSTAQTYFDSQYGEGWVTVVPIATPISLAATNRVTDSNPYCDADRISTDTSQCTAGYYYTGNGSGNIYGTTAGHCDGSVISNPVYNGTVIGTISTDYLTNGSGVDLETFLCDNPIGYTQVSWCGGGEGNIWTGSVSGSASKIVTQSCGSACSVGDLVAMDGSTTGEVDNNKIVSQTGCSPTMCGLNETTNSNVACAGGDSGGPVFQNHGSDVWANGMILAAGDGGDICLYNTMNHILSLVNGSLMTG